MTHSSISQLLAATRLNGLLTTRGGRVVAQISRPNSPGNAYVSSLVELTDDTAVPLTRGNASVGAAALGEDGTTYFTSKRVGTDGKEADDAQLWALPTRGEARELASRPGGFGSLHLAGTTLVAELSVHSQATNEAEHKKLTAERGEAKVSAILHDDFPTRYWDADLGPARGVLAVAQLPQDLSTAQPTPAPGADKADEADEDAIKQLLHFSYVTMPPGRLTSWHADASGRRALVSMTESTDELLGFTNLYLVDLSNAAEPRLIRAATADYEYSSGPISPDGTRALVGREGVWTETASVTSQAQVLDLDTGECTPLWPQHDFWVRAEWADDATVVAISDDHGRGSVWLGDINDAAPKRIAGGPGQDLSFSQAAQAGERIVALASGIAVAPHPVSIAANGTLNAKVTDLPNPADAVEQVGTLREVEAVAEDGTPLRAWLRVPEGEGPHPLVVFAHGGPWGSWNAFTYRWHPNPFVAAGYAVLLPDPAISTGYGQAMIDRGQHQLGGAPYTDILALTDAALTSPDLDSERTAFAGGSYGGYMANWVAGHTGDRFKCIVTHASLWDTESMGRTTDNSGWDKPMRSQNALYNPQLFVSDIVAPVLVIHGDKDYRVPISQGHALWYDLLTFSATPLDEEGRTQHRFLYYPDEAHWVQGLGNARVWYQTVLGFLNQHVNGTAPERTATLG